MTDTVPAITEMDARVEEHRQGLLKQQSKRSTQLYGQLRLLNKFDHYNENAVKRAVDATYQISAAAVFVCVRYMAQHTHPSDFYHPDVGSYKLYTMIDKWAQETCKQQHLLSVGAVIEACRLLEIPMCTDLRNPQQMEIAFRFIWDEAEEAEEEIE